MERYRNRSGGSGVSAYEIGPNYIKVGFTTFRTYCYSYGNAGVTHVEEMKRLAERGSELNTYINRFTKNLFD